MQTVMQSLIERIRAQYETVSGNGNDFDWGQQVAYEGILNDAEEMIKQEKDQIMIAYTAAKFHSIRKETMAGIDYYNKTYGTTPTSS